MGQRNTTRPIKESTMSCRPINGIPHIVIPNTLFDRIARRHSMILSNILDKKLIFGSDIIQRRQ